MKKTITERYIEVNEGRLAKTEFLRQVRQEFPFFVSQYNNFSDAVSILKNRGLLHEGSTTPVPDSNKFSLEAINRGVDCELESMGIDSTCIPTREQFQKAKEQALINLGKDPLYYINKLTVKPVNKPTEVQSKGVKVLKEERNSGLPEDVTKIYVEYRALSEDNFSPGELGKTSGFVFAVNEHYTRLKRLTKGIREDVAMKQALEAVISSYLRKGIKLPDYFPPLFVKSSTVREKAWKQYWHILGFPKTVDPRAATTRKASSFKHKLREQKEQKVLKQVITGIISEVLVTEAATSNLAQYSDQYASVDSIPTIINSLENVVTDVESFIIKTQKKIQDTFNKLADIKNADGIPVGYQHAQPILQKFQQDMKPVLRKFNLQSYKLPEEPSTHLENQPLEEPEQDKKDIVYAPPGLDEGKVGRYTKYNKK